MNLLSKIALLFGRRKFEEFAQANPALPDDALAVANTLDTFSVRGAVTLVAGSPVAWMCPAARTWPVCCTSFSPAVFTASHLTWQ